MAKGKRQTAVAVEENPGSDELLKNDSNCSEADQGIEVEDSVDSVALLLEDYIHSASDKTPLTRQNAVKQINRLLDRTYVYEELESTQDALMELVQKNVLRSNEDSLVLCRLVALLAIQLGAEVNKEVENVLRTLRELIADQTKPEKVRAEAAAALGLCVYLSAEEYSDLQDSLEVLHKAWSKTNSEKLASSALSAWSLLADQVDDYDEIISQHEDVVELFDSKFLQVRTTAGAALATLFEMARENDDEFAFENQELIVEKIRDLSRESVKHQSKKDRREQHFSFRPILNFLEGGEVKFGTVNLAKQMMKFESFREQNLYNALCHFLKDGLLSHLNTNLQLRDLFDLGPVQKKEEKLSGIKAIEKRQEEKKSFMKQLNQQKDAKVNRVKQSRSTKAHIGRDSD